ncbi:MAG: hypothetical protein WC690_10560, partial [bacterium]
MKIGKPLTGDEILEEMSAQAMRTRYLFGAKRTDARHINGRMISQWLAKVWVELAKKGVTKAAYVNGSLRDSDLIVRGWPSFIKALDPKEHILRKVFETQHEARALVDSGRLFMEPNGYLKHSANGRVKYRDLTGAQSTDLCSDPSVYPYVDFMLPAGAGLLFLGMMDNFFTCKKQQMYLVPGPARIDKRAIERLQSYLQHGQLLTDELSELANVIDRFGWDPPEVYIPVKVLGYRAGKNIKAIDTSELGIEG